MTLWHHFHSTSHGSETTIALEGGELTLANMITGFDTQIINKYNKGIGKYIMHVFGSVILRKIWLFLFEILDTSHLLHQWILACPI